MSSIPMREELLDALDIKIEVVAQTPSDSGRILKFDRRRKVLRKSASYNPVTWKPLYDAIILELVMFGGKKKEIAAKFKVTPQTVSNIINCEEGKVKIRAAQERVRETMLRTIPQRMGDIAEKCVDRMESFIADDTLYEKSPFAVIDRSMRFMQGAKLLASQDSQGAQATNVGLPAVSEKALDRLSVALERIGAVLPPAPKQIGV